MKIKYWRPKVRYGLVLAGILLLLVLANFLVPQFQVPLTKDHETFLAVCSSFAKNKRCVDAVFFGSEFGKWDHENVYAALCMKTCELHEGPKGYLYPYRLKARKLVKLYELTRDDQLILTQLLK